MLKTFLGYFLAVCSMLVAVVTFVGNDALGRAIASTGIRINPRFSGGEAETTLVRSGYRVIVHRPVFEALLGRSRTGFVQVDWKPDSIVAWFIVANDGGSGTPVAAIPADLAGRLGRVISDTIVLRGAATGLSLDPQRAVMALTPLDIPAAASPLTIKGVDWVPDSMVLRTRLISTSIPSGRSVRYRSVYWALEDVLPDTVSETITCGQGEVSFSAAFDTRTGAVKVSALEPLVVGNGRTYKLNHGWALRVNLERLP